MKGHIGFENIVKNLGLNKLGITYSNVVKGVFVVEGGKACQRILSEPNITVLRVIGIETIKCDGETELQLVSRNGLLIKARIPEKSRCCDVAELPLYKPRENYVGPTYKSLVDTLRQLMSGLDSYGVPVVVDTFIPSTGRYCRPRIGCTLSLRRENNRVLETSEPIRTGVYKPKVVHPTLLAWTRKRVSSNSTYHVPWIYIGGASSYLLLICIPPSEVCRVSVNKEGLAILEEGKAIAIKSRRYSPSWSYTTYLVGNALGELDANIEAKKPAIWSPTGLVPLVAHIERTRKSIVAELVVWNPLPVAKRHELVLEEYRVKKADVYTGIVPYWEEAVTSFNRVYLPLSGNQLAIVRISGNLLPPLLRQRR